MRLKEEVQGRISLREKSDRPEQLVQVKVAMATCGIASGAKQTMEFLIDELESQHRCVVTRTVHGLLLCGTHHEVTLSGAGAVVSRSRCAQS